MSLSSAVVILEINLNRITILPSERNAPIPCHCNDVPAFKVAGQRVKSQAEKVKVFRCGRRVKRVKR